MRIAYIEASWHYDIVKNAHTGFEKTISDYDFGEEMKIDMFRVPGSLEIPLIAQKLIDTGKFDYIVWTGLVVDGGIYEHRFVGNAILQGLVKISTERRIPVFSVILTPQIFDENSSADIEKFGSHFIEKWAEAWRAVIQMHETLKKVESFKK